MSAVDAAVAVAAAYGLRSDKPVVLSEAWHVLVHLRPWPVVARVTSGAAGVDPADVERELTVASHAARAGAPVVQPSDCFRPARTPATGTRSSSGAISPGPATSTRPLPAEGSAGSTTRLWTTTASFPVAAAQRR